MAGFQVITYGRFWVITEEKGIVHLIDVVDGKTDYNVEDMP